MSTRSQKIPCSNQAWESGELGMDLASVKVSSPQTEQSINNALELELISIRLQKELIADLKRIADRDGLNWKPLIRQTLTRFVDVEKNRGLQDNVE